MDRTLLPDDIRALNTKLLADPALTENMGPVHILTVPGRRSGRPKATPVSPVTGSPSCQCRQFRALPIPAAAWDADGSSCLVDRARRALFRLVLRRRHVLDSSLRCTRTVLIALAAFFDAAWPFRFLLNRSVMTRPRRPR